MAFPPSCTFSVSFFLSNNGEIPSRWRFTPLLNYVKLFYLGSVGSFPVHSDILSWLGSVPGENMHNRLIPLNDKESLGAFHRVGVSALPPCKCTKADPWEASVLCKGFDLLNSSKDLRYLI